MQLPVKLGQPKIKLHLIHYLRGILWGKKCRLKNVVRLLHIH